MNVIAWAALFSFKAAKWAEHKPHLYWKLGSGGLSIYLCLKQLIRQWL